MSNLCMFFFHQKLNGTESQRTPKLVSCDRAFFDTQVFFFRVRSFVGPTVGDFLDFWIVKQPLHLRKCHGGIWRSFRCRSHRMESESSCNLGKVPGRRGVGERGLVGKKVGFPSRSKSTIKGMGWITKDLLILKDLFHQQFHGRLVDYYFTGRLFPYRGFLLQSVFF